MTRPTYLLSMLILAVLGTMLVITSYQLWWPINPVTTNEIKLLSDEVQAGGVLRVYIDVTKHIDKPAMVVRQLINDTIITLSPAWSHVPMGRTRMVTYLKLPDHIPPGRYKLSVSYTYEINSFRNITVRWETAYFTVLERAK